MFKCKTKNKKQKTKNIKHKTKNIKNFYNSSPITISIIRLQPHPNPHPLPIHGGVIFDNNILLDVGLGRRQTELNQGYFGVGDLSGSIAAMTDLIAGEHHAVNHFSVFQSATHALANLDIPQVHIMLDARVDDLKHRIHSDRRQSVARTRHDL